MLDGPPGAPHYMRIMRPPLRVAVVALSLSVLSCGYLFGPENADPGPGPHFSVVPIDIAKLARVTPVGTNGKVLPIGHTYWYTCDTEYLMPVERPCVRERLAIRAPADGKVFAVEGGPDGGITIEGPPGLHASFAHVTPRAGLRRGNSVRAGDTIATMFYDYAFDFGVTNYGRDEHRFVTQSRYADAKAYRFSESPITQFAEPLRSQLIERVSTQSDPLGRISFDIAGTAAGGWFTEGVPANLAFTAPYESSLLFLGPLQERADTRILVQEAGWFIAFLGLGVVDPADPKWESITPSSGLVWLRLWLINRNGGPDYAEPRGGVLVEVQSGERLRIQWFNTHTPVAAFTSGAKVFVR